MSQDSHKGPKLLRLASQRKDCQHMGSFEDADYHYSGPRAYKVD